MAKPVQIRLFEITAMEPCQLLEWDSQFFGARIARVSGPLLDDLDLARVNAWCDANGIDCLQWLAEGDQPSLGRLAHAGGFRFVDVRLTLPYVPILMRHSRSLPTDQGGRSSRHGRFDPGPRHDRRRRLASAP